MNVSQFVCYVVEFTECEGVKYIDIYYPQCSCLSWRRLFPATSPPFEQSDEFLFRQRIMENVAVRKQKKTKVFSGFEINHMLFLLPSLMGGNFMVRY